MEQLLDAKTNVSPMSRRRDARRSLRADRPRSESGSDGRWAAYPGRNVRSRRGACAGETRSEGALYGQGFFLPEVGGLFSAVRSKTLKKKSHDLPKISIQSSLGSTKHRRMRSRGPPDPISIPEGVQEPIYIRKK